MPDNAEKINQDIKESSSEISLKELFAHINNLIHYILSKWLSICLFAVVGAAIGFLYGKFTKPTYTAVSTFVLDDGDGGRGGLSQYSGIASMVGLDLGGGSGGIFQGDNIIELYKSRVMIKKTLLSEVDINGKKKKLINYYIDFNKLRSKWKTNELKTVDFDTVNFNRIQDSLISDFTDEINKKCLTVSKPDKKLSIIEVETKSKNELFAKLFNDKIVQNVNEFYVQTKTKKSLNNIKILQNQTDSVYHALNGAMGRSAQAIDANPNANLSRQVLKLPSQRGQIDAEASKAIYAELVKNLEISKIGMRKESPLIQIIDTPVYPLESDKKPLIFYIIVYAFAFSFIQILRLIIKRLLF